MMWRPAHGATSRPGPCRPASGYGRELGRPGPRVHEAPAVNGHAMPDDVLEPVSFVERGEPANEAEAPATP
jgi:hypothetical protein